MQREVIDLYIALRAFAGGLRTDSIVRGFRMIMSSASAASFLYPVGSKSGFVYVDYAAEGGAPGEPFIGRDNKIRRSSRVTSRRPFFWNSNILAKKRNRQDPDHCLGLETIQFVVTGTRHELANRSEIPWRITPGREIGQNRMQDGLHANDLRLFWGGDRYSRCGCRSSSCAVCWRLKNKTKTKTQRAFGSDDNPKMRRKSVTITWLGMKA